MGIPNRWPEPRMGPHPVPPQPAAKRSPIKIAAAALALVAILFFALVLIVSRFISTGDGGDAGPGEKPTNTTPQYERGR